jgi:hypothetical protein
MLRLAGAADDTRFVPISVEAQDRLLDQPPHNCCLAKTTVTHRETRLLSFE